MEGFNFNRLERRFLKYPEALKTGNTDAAAVLTGYTHAEYLHAVEVQQASLGSDYLGGRR